MASHSSILAWKIPGTDEFGGLQSMGCKECYTTEHACYNLKCKTFHNNNSGNRSQADLLKPFLVMIT